MYSDGYKYWLAYKKNKTSYYRCSRYKTLCPGRCVVEDTKVRSSTEHNHPPEPDRVLVDKFRKVLTQRAATESTDLYTIYWEEASQRHSDAALLYIFSAAESAMRKARRKQLPQAPHEISELGDVLSNSNLFRIHSGSLRDQFYQTTLTLKDTTCVIFIHLKTLEVVGLIEELHINASLDAEPQTPPSYHLLIMHAIRAYQNIPIMYVIMTSKTYSGYAAVFAYIREHLSEFISPNVIMCNYDPDIQSALAYTFPDATLKGYWFQYTDAVLRFMKSVGLQWDKTRGHGLSCVRMLLVLPLLPAEYISPGLNAIRKWAREKQILSSQLEQVCVFVEQSWLRAVGADKMSIFGLPHAVYNHIHLFNKSLRNSLGEPSPLIWYTLECITHIATRTFVKYNRRQRTAQPKPNKSQQAIDTIIKNATQLWIRTPIHMRNPLQFLQLCSHCINDSIYYTYLDDTKLTGIDTVAAPTPSLVPVSLSASCSATIATLPKLIKVTEAHHSLASSSTKCSNEPSLTSQNTPSNKQINESSTTTQAQYRISTDPPPLAFFSRNVRQSRRPIIFSATEPPPLVPIQRRVK